MNADYKTKIDLDFKFNLNSIIKSAVCIENDKWLHPIQQNEQN